MGARRKRFVLVGALVLSCAAIAYAYDRANADVFKMPNAAMEPTIKAGESFRVDLSAYETADPQRWDVVVFRPPQSEIDRHNLKKSQRWLFRVVGLPGEPISFNNNELLIDGKSVDLPHHLENVSYSELATGAEDPFIVPKNSYYLLGDNSAKANDSRNWGSVPRDAIVGKLEDR